MDAIALQFTWIDWATLLSYLAFTTWIGHHLSGKQSTLRDFFLAGRQLPWPAVSASIIATAISAITFIGVPSLVFAAEGNFVYLQAAIGSILARIIVAVYFVPAFYEKEIYSPYDYMERKLGPFVGKLTTCLFFLGSILGQGVRVYATALVLQIITGWPIGVSVAIIGAFAVLWTWMGGMATVIWTDVVQFFVFIGGGLFTILFILLHLPFSLSETIHIAHAYGKLEVWDFSHDPRVTFSLWTALLAWPFQNLASYGTDQLNAQRMFCCRGPREASRAILWSCLSEFITLTMLIVGALLFIFYQTYPLSPQEALAVAEENDRIYPIFIVTQLPPGLTGLIIAAVFAAAISSLDSILAALSQTTLTTFYKPYFAPNSSPREDVQTARSMVLVWGILLSSMAYSFSFLSEDPRLINLAFAMTSYTYGPMLGIFLLAFLPFKRDAFGLFLGVPASLLITFLFQQYLLGDFSGSSLTWYWAPDKKIVETLHLTPILSYVWLFPIGTLVTLSCGVLLGRRTE